MICNQPHYNLNKYTISSNFFYFLIFLAFSLLKFSPYLIYQAAPTNDWDYFNSLSYFNNLSIFTYKTLPLHDPYLCGGIDVLANPQTYLFSPSIFLNLFFGAYLGNIISLILFSAFGGVGMMRLLQYFCVNKNMQLLGGLIFLSSNWFSMHFLEGHLVFRSFFLIPWVVYFTFNLSKNIKYHLYSSLILLFFLLDGGIYAFNFSILFLAIAIMVKKPKLSEILAITFKNKKITALIILAFILAALVKIIPTLLAHLDKTPLIHFYTYSAKDIFLSFFYPFNLLQDTSIKDEYFLSNFKMHEYVCYIGFFWLIPLSIALFKKHKISHLRILSIFLLICLWIGIGFGYLLNPWSALQLTPLLNHSHIQSRFLIFFWIFFTIILVKLLDSSQKKYFWSFLILVELTLVGFYPVIKEFNRISNQTTYQNLKIYQKHNIENTVTFIPKPKIYFSGQNASKECYDPTQIKTNILAKGDDNYKGEFYSKNNKGGKLTLEKRQPSLISASYSGTPGEIFIFNTNYLLGWKSNSDDYKIKSQNGLLAIEMLKSQVKINASYQPNYLIFIIISFFSGALIYLYIFKNIYGRKQGQV